MSLNRDWRIVPRIEIEGWKVEEGKVWFCFTSEMLVYVVGGDRGGARRPYNEFRPRLTTRKLD